MDRPIATTHGLDALKNATRGLGVSAGRKVKAAAKSAAKDKLHLWDSSFHAERGCLSGDLPLRCTTPLPHH